MSGMVGKGNLIPVKVKAVVPSMYGYAVFLISKEKSFVIYVEPVLGEALTSALQKKTHDRPLTHELIQNILLGLEVKVDYVIINEVNNYAFLARLFLKMKNELGTKIVEIDARPSDSMVMAVQAGSPIFATQQVIDNVQDMSEALERVLKKEQNEEEHEF